ncbi:MAG: hypothetical protein ACYS6Z_07420 [Planctomycetota bacterium]
MPILLPGFACVLAVHAHLPDARPPQTFGGFLTLLLLLPFTAAVFGLFIQALRFVTFDWIVKLFKERGVNEDSPDAYHYGLYANLCVFWVVFYLASLFAHLSESWKHPWRFLGYVVILVLIGFALAWAAMLAYDRSHRFTRPADTSAPAARKRKTTRKKTT